MTRLPAVAARFGAMHDPEPGEMTPVPQSLPRTTAIHDPEPDEVAHAPQSPDGATAMHDLEPSEIAVPESPPDAVPLHDRVAVVVCQVTAAEVPDVVEPLFREYGEWVAQRFLESHGIVFTDADLERHHEAFRAELLKLLGPRGRLVVAWCDGEPVGVGALKPVDDTTAEVKRMYVRPQAQGRGAGRAILGRLLADARAEGYRVARLETADFMTPARALYTSLGFVETSMFDGSELAGTPFEPFAHYLEQRLT